MIIVLSTLWISTEKGMIYIHSLKDFKKLRTITDHSGRVIRSLLLTDAEVRSIFFFYSFIDSLFGLLMKRIR